MNAADKIYNALREKIIDGTIKQNDLITESALATEYEVSKAPVREALRKLCYEGYLISYPRKGYFINEISNDECINIQQLRFSLESAVVHYIISSASDEAIESLYDIIKPVDGPKEKNPFNAVNTRFHIAMAELLDNKLYAQTLSQYVGTITRVVIRFPLLNNYAKDVHGDLVAAMLRRDEQAALDFLYADLSSLFQFKR